MPTYSYACLTCDREFEALRPIVCRDDSPCPNCGSSSTKRHVSACHFVFRESGTVRKLTDRGKFEAEAKADLAENYGVAKINPIRNTSIANIYRDVKQQGSFVKDRMQQSAADNETKTRKKQREWAIEAHKRTPTRAKIIRDFRAKEAMQKRAIKL